MQNVKNLIAQIRCFKLIVWRTNRFTPVMASIRYRVLYPALQQNGDGLIHLVADNGARCRPLDLCVFAACFSHCSSPVFWTFLKLVSTNQEAATKMGHSLAVQELAMILP